MSIPTGGLAALLVVATLAVSGCGSDDGTATATTVVTVPPTAAQTTTQQSTAKAPSTTTQKTQTATTPPATTQKTQATTPASTPKPAKATPARICEPIGVGLRPGDVDTTYARITRKNNLPCPQAAYVVAQWGAQQIGIDKALLPSGWKCSSNNVCRGGNKSVTFVLEYPED